MKGRRDSLVDLATEIAWSFHGLPYKWGGDDPMAGFDCSGFVIEILKSVGLLPREGDWRARDLFPKFTEVFTPVSEGVLVFWHSSSDPKKIIHVEYCLDNTFSIGASGGGGSTMTEQDAIEQNAYIKVRPFRSRKYLFGFCDPFEIEV